jgi:hypothetical protein
MPANTENVCSPGKTGSGRRTAKTALQNGAFDQQETHAPHQLADLFNYPVDAGKQRGCFSFCVGIPN